MIDGLLRDAIGRSGWRNAPAGDPQSPEEYLALLRVLYTTGRGDLPLGRLLEGHVDAVQIVLRYGAPEQVATLREVLARGATLGVWNAALPGEPLVLADCRLSGGKSYASGAGVLSHALVTADTDARPQLLLLDLARTAPEVQLDWWRTDGMQRSESHRVRWDAAPVVPADLIGAPGDYAREPFFSGGALRFVAVHAGGVAGLCDRAREHLVATDRAGDPFQAARLAELFTLANAAATVVRVAAERWFEDEGEARLARVAAARLTVTELAERAIVVAREAVGLSALFVDHPLSAALADLTAYLRQPAPDAQRLRVGEAVAAGKLSPSL